MAIPVATHGRAPQRIENGIEIEAHEWGAWPQLASAWSSVVGASEHPTFFVTNDAVETWLEVYGESLRPSIVVFRDGEDVVGACLLVRRTERVGPFFVRRVYLNTAGEDDADSVCVELNQLLCRPGYEASVAEALREHLDDQPWDELVAPGMSDFPSLQALRVAFADCAVRDNAKLNHVVDLETVRGSGDDFVAKLSSRERTRYRQNVRKYSEIGEVVLETAQTTDHALAILDDLARLHQATWRSRGESGSFASARFFDYHRRLVARCFPERRVELVRVRAGSVTIGCHYDLIASGSALFYQCGYDYELRDKTNPGLVVQAFTIRHHAERGIREYDLMAGDSEYKRRLGTASRTMHWLTWQAPTFKMRAFELARRGRRVVRAALGNLGKE